VFHLVLGFVLYRVHAMAHVAPPLVRKSAASPKWSDASSWTVTAERRWCSQLRCRGKGMTPRRGQRVGYLT
jgi:hypothetical protein